MAFVGVNREIPGHCLLIPSTGPLSKYQGEVLCPSLTHLTNVSSIMKQLKILHHRSDSQSTLILILDVNNV